MGKLKVVLSGIYYPVAIVRYFQHAFMRRDDVDLYTVGPYTGRSIPWANGMFVDCPLPGPDLVLSLESNDRANIRHIETLLPWKPDVWIQVDAAYHLVGKPSCKQFFIGTDPHCVNYDRQREWSDVFFNMQTPYMKEGDFWLPYAYDPMYHAPMPQEAIYDFGIVGADGRQGPLYYPRDQLVAALRDMGYSVLQIFGKAWGEYRQLLTQCRVGLNWSTRLDTTARVFETMAMGCALLTNITPDLGKLGFNREIDFYGFGTVGEVIEEADNLLRDRWMVASRGFTKVQPHTWDARVETVLSHV